MSDNNYINQFKSKVNFFDVIKLVVILLIIVIQVLFDSWSSFWIHLVILLLLVAAFCFKLQQVLNKPLG